MHTGKSVVDPGPPQSPAHAQLPLQALAHLPIPLQASNILDFDLRLQMTYFPSTICDDLKCTFKYIITKHTSNMLIRCLVHSSASIAD